MFHVKRNILSVNVKYPVIGNASKGILQKLLNSSIILACYLLRSVYFILFFFFETNNYT